MQKSELHVKRVDISSFKFRARYVLLLIGFANKWGSSKLRPKPSYCVLVITDFSLLAKVNLVINATNSELRLGLRCLCHLV